MANSVDPDQLASLIWIYTVCKCKGRVYPCSAGQGLMMLMQYLFLIVFIKVYAVGTQLPRLVDTNI